MPAMAKGGGLAPFFMNVIVWNPNAENFTLLPWATVILAG